MNKTTEEYIKILEKKNIHDYKIINNDTIKITHNYYIKCKYELNHHNMNNLTTNIIKMIENHNIVIISIEEYNIGQNHIIQFDTNITKDEIEELKNSRYIDTNIYNLITYDNYTAKKLNFTCILFDESLIKNKLRTTKNTKITFDLSIDNLLKNIIYKKKDSLLNKLFINFLSFTSIYMLCNISSIKF